MKHTGLGPSGVFHTPYETVWLGPQAPVPAPLAVIAGAFGPSHTQTQDIDGATAGQFP